MLLFRGTIRKRKAKVKNGRAPAIPASSAARPRSEEHTSELQSQSNLVCRLLLEKKHLKMLLAGTIRQDDSFLNHELETVVRRQPSRNEAADELDVILAVPQTAYDLGIKLPAFHH